jgi:hypothetical protein
MSLSVAVASHQVSVRFNCPGVLGDLDVLPLELSFFNASQRP